MINSQLPCLTVLQTLPGFWQEAGMVTVQEKAHAPGSEACDNHERGAKHKVLGKMPQCGSGTDFPWSPGLSS